MVEFGEGCGGSFDRIGTCIEHNHQYRFAGLGICRHGARRYSALDDRFWRGMAHFSVAGLEVGIASGFIPFPLVCDNRFVVKFSDRLDVQRRDLCIIRLGHDRTAVKNALPGREGGCKRNGTPPSCPRQSAGVGRTAGCNHIYSLVEAMDFRVGKFSVGCNFTWTNANHCMV